MNEADVPVLPRHVRVAVIGAGFGGLGAAIALQKARIEDFVVFEKDADVGGTWRANRYPGCQCDVPSNLYSFSFALNSEWSQAFAIQPEIEKYLLRVTDEYRLRPKIQFNCEVQSARWSDKGQCWEIATSLGALTADCIISGHGGLSAPATPDIPGLDQFAGEVFHSARWNQEFDLRGKRVAVIGTGATGVQIVPTIQPIVEKLYVFQRTPGWIVPRPDHVVPAWRKKLYRRMPWVQRLSRLRQYLLHEVMIFPYVHYPRLRKYVERAALRHMENQVSDPELREKLTPNYSIGCKRILLSNEFYPALQTPNTMLVTEPIAEVTREGIRLANSETVALDAIILATGFHVATHPMMARVFGRDGRSFAEHASAAGPKTLFGITAAGFPNLFLLAGPNTGIGHTSLVYMIECQIRYALNALRWMNRTGATAIEPREEACAAFAAEMERRLANSVWNAGGCKSWYLGETGRNTTIWPGPTFEYARRTRQFDPGKYDKRMRAESFDNNSGSAGTPRMKDE